ncbi:hypothetical protein JB92DRAFT_3104488 [Gautieria morchelliformis]|nr:hypothetical protein JB92DRAFT_3104488 [Gautieria morchelliformis]
MAPPSYPSGSSGHPYLQAMPPTSSTSSAAVKHPNSGAPSNTTPGNTVPQSPVPDPSASVSSQRTPHRRPATHRNTGQRERRPTSSQVIEQLNASEPDIGWATREGNLDT